MNNNLFKDFTNLFSLTKTLRFELKPTLETKSLAEVIKEDKDIDRLYNEEMKPMFDKLHEEFITDSLENVKLSVDKLVALEKSLLEKKEFRKDKKITKEIICELENKKEEEIVVLQKYLREEVVKLFNKKGDEWRDEKYPNLKLKDVGYKILTEARVLEILKLKNTDKKEIIEKFGKFFTYFSGFIQNRENYYSNEDKSTSVANRVVNENLVRFLDNKQKFEEVSKKVAQIKKFEEVFSLENYDKCLTQLGIEKFNLEIVGEINKELNLFSQQNRDILPKAPKLKFLYKQIGCGKRIFDLFSIIVGNEWKELKNLQNNKDDGKSFSQKELLEKIRKLYTSNGWETFLAIWEYEINESFKVLDNNVAKFELKKQTKFQNLDKKERVFFIKEFCDAFLAIERMVKYHKVDENNDTDDNFYETIDLYLQETELRKYYDAFRNYLTEKPFSENKIKLNFKSGTLLGGWSQTFETYGSLIFEKNGEYFLGIINGTKFSESELNKIYNINSDSIKAKRLLYNTQKIDNKNPPRWFIRSKKTTFSPMVREGLLDPESILELYDKKLYSKTENKNGYKEYLPRLLDYFKDGFLKHKDFVQFKENFKWLDNSEYDTVVDFYNHTADMCYKTSWEDINFTELENLTKDSRIYLFKIYNKDFAEKTSGIKNSHTILFLELLKSENNLKLKLLGGGEVFYREKSIEKEIDKERSFKTDKFEIIKNKRYSEEKYFLHFPIEIKGRKLRGSFNQFLNKEISKKESVNILGIDRGEKHLLYYSLVNNNGEIIKQGSFNKIKCGNKIVDYNELLSKRAKEMMEARQSWETIGKIKDLKEGYLSQVIHEIYKLVIENNAIVVLEDLNTEFKAKRTSKVEKSVYKKFELALVKKLNHLILKEKEANELGGSLNAYQLAPYIKPGDVGKFEKAKQWGIMFYVRPDYTSQTDPVTGWRKTIYISNAETIINIKKKWKDANIKIYFDSDKKCFKFSYDKWELCAYPNLERLYWNRSEKNVDGKFGNMKKYSLHKEFECIFEGVNKSKNISDQMFDKEDFNWKSFIFYWNLLNQIRNSDKSKDENESDFIQSPIWSEKINDFFDSRKKYQIDLPEKV